MSAPALRLRALPFLVRVGLSGVVAALALGLWASLEHVREHHQNRDGQAGVSSTDLLGAYHGVSVPAPLVTALERGHPEALAPADRDALLAWLRGADVSQRYDDPDLGERAPAELLGRSCLACHARRATDGDGIGERVPLEYWDDVAKLAQAQELAATPRAILVTTTHTHALALGTLAVIVGALAWATRFGKLRELVIAAMGIGLAADLASWWLVRESASWLWLLIGAGALYAASTALALVLVLAELWLPKRD
ncbi:MAG: hypothetical protein EPO68_09410 [Planctomycetota bacterium]|nr:MAG: hypothetical protein EPO68_09410 [Planctomycetota bacterium]